MNLAKRLERLEQRLGPPPPPIADQITVRALASFSTEELYLLEGRAMALERGDPFEDTPVIQDIARRLARACEALALEMTGKSYAELLSEEAKGQRKNN
jgi:hypothetical protein